MNFCHLQQNKNRIQKIKTEYKNKWNQQFGRKHVEGAVRQIKFHSRVRQDKTRWDKKYTSISSSLLFMKSASTYASPICFEITNGRSVRMVHLMWHIIIWFSFSDSIESNKFHTCHYFYLWFLLLERKYCPYFECLFKPMNAIVTTFNGTLTSSVSLIVVFNLFAKLQARQRFKYILFYQNLFKFFE